MCSENVNLIIESLKLIVKLGVLLLHLRQINGVSHVFRQVPVGFVLVGMVVLRFTLLTVFIIILTVVVRVNSFHQLIENSFGLLVHDVLVVILLV